MIKLALIGKDIQHSRSPQLYRELIKDKIEYDLLDYQSPLLIPSANHLFLQYQGVSITSPYKKHFLGEVELTQKAKELGAINCLALKNGKVVGENTDYLAILDILNFWKNKYHTMGAIVLGDGVMSRVAQAALLSLGISFKTYSRKTVENFDRLNLSKEFSSQFDNISQKIVINTCAREFVFKGELDHQTIFWDFNYNFSPHHYSIPKLCQEYVDGSEMLERQARYALAFWSITSH